jgi:DnaK suppressor protein
MNQRKDFFERMEHALREKKNELLTEVNSLNNKKPEKPEGGDICDEALNSEIDKVQNSLLSAELQEVAQIDFALNLLVHGEYGLCQDCSDEISTQRLEHYPYAQRCIACQELHEKQGK